MTRATRLTRSVAWMRPTYSLDGCIGLRRDRRRRRPRAAAGPGCCASAGASAAPNAKAAQDGRADVSFLRPSTQRAKQPFGADRNGNRVKLLSCRSFATPSAAAARYHGTDGPQRHRRQRRQGAVLVNWLWIGAAADRGRGLRAAHAREPLRAGRICASSASLIAIGFVVGRARLDRRAVSPRGAPS